EPAGRRPHSDDERHEANPAHHVYIYRSGDFFNVTEISRVMTFKRFQAILNSLHINDRDKEKKKGEEGHDKDNHNINITSNFHHPEETCKVNRRLSSGTKVGVSCPKVIADYNQWMGGVDRLDQKRNTYVADRCSKK
ncbi:hypothetical protein HPB47_019568, partial [Ixodes persulcatus]